MLFDYVAPKLQSSSQPLGARTVWSQFPLQPLAPGALSPLSSSVIAELTSRAWYLYYDRLGFDPTPRARIVRRYKGHLYFNLSLSAQLEATNAAVEPLALRVNGQQQPLATWEKPGFLAGFKVGRAQKKIDDLLADSARQIAAVTEKARAWYLKTQSIQRWGQAEVLQIMEEIERVGVESMVAFLAARLNLGYLYTRLLADLSGGATNMGAPKSNAQGLLLINEALGGLSGLVEAALLDMLPNIAASLGDPSTLAWLKAGNFATWRTELPNKEAVERINTFMSTYGHRAAHEGEMANARWSEDAGLLMQALLATIEAPSAARPSANSGLPTLMAALPSSARKQGEQAMQKIGEMHKLQSNALNSLAYIWAGTRSWALAAAREAMVDKRLHSTDEVFLFDLEEIKQLMTGEWNVSSLDEIRAATDKRRLEHSSLDMVAPDLLLDDDEAFATEQGLAGVAGKAGGALCLWDGAPGRAGHNEIVATTLLDSGYVLALPLAGGFVAAAGSPCDPFVIAANRWQRPVVLSLGKGYCELREGAPTTVAVNGATVTVSQE
jgi:hypothetical protein